MSKKSELKILDALNNLTTIIDADSLEEIEVTEEQKFVLRKESSEEIEEEHLRDIYWVQAGLDNQTFQTLEETFRAVFDYLQIFYNTMHEKGDSQKLVRGVNTIMVLVGEAAQKLDKFGSLFRKKLSDIPEYKELKNFYKQKVVEQFKVKPASVPKKEKTLSEEEGWTEEIKEILQGHEEAEEVAGVHILNEIDTIKQDNMYELFYLKNESGNDFYTQDLGNQIKLACDFGIFAEEYSGDDPFLQIKNWEDKQRNLQAASILKLSKKALTKFYKIAIKYKQVEAVEILHNACMALMLASNPRNMIRQFSLKGCYLYFHDFLLFLRSLLQNREFERLIIYGASDKQPFWNEVIELSKTFCTLLFTQPVNQEEVTDAIVNLISRSKGINGKSLSQVIQSSHRALEEACKKHPNGPAFKALDLVSENQEVIWDPLRLGNLPCLEWTLSGRSTSLYLIRMACPVEQENINVAHITEEFKLFLRSCKKDERFLFIDFQDRTSWQEFARSRAIVELGNNAEFANNLTVVTLAKDTDFYNQVADYYNLDNAASFIEQFYEHLLEENTGYQFPHIIKKELFPEFIKPLLTTIHSSFFNNRKTLSFTERLDFIEIAYNLIILKVIEVTQPTYITLSSKDALDVGGTSSVGFVAFLSLDSNTKLDVKKIQTIIFGPTLMLRERVVHADRCDRLAAFISILEKTKNYLDPFRDLFKKETLFIKPQ